MKSKNKSFIIKLYTGILKEVKMVYQDIKKQKHTSLIIDVLKRDGKIRRGDLYQEVMKKQKEKYGKATTYQVISRDTDRLINQKIIKIVSGGKRSQILTLQ